MSKIMILLYVAATSLALVFLKLGTSAGAPITFVNSKPHLNLTLYGTLGIVLYGISFLLYTFLIAKYDLGYIIPLATGIVYVAIFAASYFIFKEAFTPFKILGITLIIGGIVFLNLNK